MYKYIAHYFSYYQGMQKFFPLMGIIFFSFLNDRLLSSTKDALFITAPASGAESLAFLKMWCVLPAMVICSMMYIKLRQHSSLYQAYHITLLVFIIFFCVFNTILYPHTSIIHWSLNDMMALKKDYIYIQHVIPILGNWTFSLYYIFSELWSTLCITILFWQCANDMVSTDEARVLYPILIIVSNIAAITASVLMQQLSYFRDYHIVLYNNYIVITSAICLIYILKHFRTKNSFMSHVPHENIKRPCMRTTIKDVLCSPYVCAIVMLVVSQGIILGIFEQTWKSQVKELHSSIGSYYNFMAYYMLYSALVSIVCTFATRNVIRRYAWRSIASITPVLMTCISILFFCYIIFKDTMHGSIVYLGSDPLVFVVSVGMWGVIFSRFLKNSFFSSSKEMAFIVLEDKLKVSGKAFADGLGHRVGQSASGIIQQILLIVTIGDQIIIAPYLGFIVVCIGGVWVFSVRYLSQLYERRLVGVQENSVI